MTRRTTVAAGVLGLSLLAPAPGSAATTEHFTYVAGSGVGTALDPVTLTHVTPWGQIFFAPHGETVTLRIDDLGVQDGQTVAVSGVPGQARQICVPVRKNVRLTGFTPGFGTTLWIDGDLAAPTAPRRCTGHALGGTADVTS
jgi:hypothetical protein